MRWMSIWVLVVAGGAGCLGTTEPPNNREYALLVLEGRQEAAGPMVEPTAVFYRAGPLQLVTSVVTEDNCVVLRRSEPGAPANVLFLDAGDPVTLSLSGQNVELEPEQTATGTRYVLRGETRIAFQPGDTARLSVPGTASGFPAFTIRGKTAEAFTMSPVAVPPANESLTLSWSPVPPPAHRHSKMTVQLRYSLLDASQLTDYFVYCELLDDGQHVVASTLLDGWRTAHDGERSVIATRWRVTSQSVSGAGIAQVLSVFETTVPIAE